MVQALEIAEGDTVEAGQILARLDAAQQQAVLPGGSHRGISSLSKTPWARLILCLILCEARMSYPIAVTYASSLLKSVR
ncbi:MAG: biotin/lipoyl-binding protein [Litorilinea sp.]